MPGEPRAAGNESHRTRRTKLRRTIVPDYARPLALMVPHSGFEIRPLLEAIAVEASKLIGIILLSDDPPVTQAFVEAQQYPDRFSIVGAEFDTPWIRDRAPIAVRESGILRWLLPRLPPESRPLDDRLFTAIAAHETEPAPIMAAQGNLVAGPRGIALSTTRILAENRFSDAAQLDFHAPIFGIRKWIVFERFPDEPTGHADVHARFLRSDLLAVGWHADDRGIQERAIALEQAVLEAAPKIRVIRIPIVREGGKYASLANWIQVGPDVLVPKYDVTPDADIEEAIAILGEVGFRATTISSPTLDLDGSLHCLTASVYL